MVEVSGAAELDYDRVWDGCAADACKVTKLQAMVACCCFDVDCAPIQGIRSASLEWGMVG